MYVHSRLSRNWNTSSVRLWDCSAKRMLRRNLTDVFWRAGRGGQTLFSDTQCQEKRKWAWTGAQGSLWRPGSTSVLYVESSPWRPSKAACLGTLLWVSLLEQELGRVDPEGPAGLNCNVIQTYFLPLFSWNVVLHSIWRWQTTTFILQEQLGRECPGRRAGAWRESLRYVCVWKVWMESVSTDALKMLFQKAPWGKLRREVRGFFPH